jgi:hypothetical protein
LGARTVFSGPQLALNMLFSYLQGSVAIVITVSTPWYLYCTVVGPARVGSVRFGCIAWRYHLYDWDRWLGQGRFVESQEDEPLFEEFVHGPLSPVVARQRDGP